VSSHVPFFVSDPARTGSDGTSGVLLALRSMSPSPIIDPFDEDAPTRDMFDTDGSRTRLTIRAKTAPRRWRVVRWWVGLTMAVVAIGVGLKLVDSRHSGTRHYLRDPERRAAISTPVSHIKQRLRIASPHTTVKRAGRQKHRKRSSRRIRHRASSAQRRFTRPAAVGVEPAQVPASIAAPPTTGEAPPSSAPQAGSRHFDSQPSAREKGDEPFAYLGR
jgi:hypothetical protein